MNDGQNRYADGSSKFCAAVENTTTLKLVKKIKKYAVKIKTVGNSSHLRYGDILLLLN